MTGDPRTYDVVVGGSGAAGLTAALAAAVEGLSVLVLERGDQIGGTSAYSGGMIWAPCNEHFHERNGEHDSREAALEYIRGLVQERGYDDSLLETYVDESGPTVAFIEKHTPLRFAASQTYTDYFYGRAGSTRGGRSVAPIPFSATSVLGDQEPRVITSPHFPIPLTLDELAGSESSDPRNDGGALLQSADLRALARQRKADGYAANGRALIAGLLAGFLDAGGTVETGARVVGLTGGRDGVTGVVIETEGGRSTVAAQRGVVLATAGFEWDRELLLAFLGTEDVAPVSVPTNTGDGLRMALAVGAGLANMTASWGIPATLDPERIVAGHPLPSLVSTRFEGGSIAVNREGRRFVNEGAQYTDFTKAFLRFDEVTQTYPNRSPAWLIFDQQVRDHVVVNDLKPGQPTPAWVLEAPALDALAELIDVPVDALAATVARFNENARAHRDPDFARGEVWFEGQASGGPSPESLTPIENAPFYATRLHHGLFGTAGGLRLDERGRVRALDGNGAIPGLYAAGNVAASIFGTTYPGGGITLGLAVTFGRLAGQTIATG